MNALPMATEELSLIAICSAIVNGGRVDLIDLIKVDLPAINKLAKSLQRNINA